MCKSLKIHINWNRVSTKICFKKILKYVLSCSTFYNDDLFRSNFEYYKRRNKAQTKNVRPIHKCFEFLGTTHLLIDGPK